MPLAISCPFFFLVLNFSFAQITPDHINFLSKGYSSILVIILYWSLDLSNKFLFQYDEGLRAESESKIDLALSSFIQSYEITPSGTAAFKVGNIMMSNQDIKSAIYW